MELAVRGVTDITENDSKSQNGDDNKHLKSNEKHAVKRSKRIAENLKNVALRHVSSLLPAHTTLEKRSTVRRQQRTISG